MKNYCGRKNKIPALYGVNSILGPGMEELFSKFFREPFELSDTMRDIFPSTGIVEKEDRITVKSEVPGVEKEDLNIRIDGSKLTISGEKRSETKDDKNGRYYEERVFGSFSRTITLPEDINDEDIKASYKDGVLTVDIPRSREGKKSRDINVE